MTNPKPPKTTSEAARRVAEREKITERSIETWQEMNRRYAQLCIEKHSPQIMEESRIIAVASYEVMLDAIRSERDALTMLDAIRESKLFSLKRRPPNSKPKDSA